MSTRNAGWAVLLGTALAACTASTASSAAAGVAVGIAPASTSVRPSGSVQFAASVTGTDDDAVTWSVEDCGSVTQTGLYTAPATTGTCHVVATSHADPSRSARATVEVTTSTTTAWRPFSASSPWNTPIPPSPDLEANSAQLVANFIASYTSHQLDLNISACSIPLYWADASSPSVPMKAQIGGEGWNGEPATANMPMPAGATPDPSSDHHLLVISADRTREYGCYNASYSATASPQWQAKLCATSDLTGSGVRVPQPVANPWYLAHGARACGFPLVAGLIRVEEIQAGSIDHALVIAYPGILKNHFTPPASTVSVIGVDTGGVPCGGRFQYDPSVDVTTLGLSRAGQIIVRALQVYGAYVGDFSGSLSLYAENSAAAQAYWNGGVLGEGSLHGLDLTKLRVVKYGTMY